jgi:hypothetical protein
MSQKSHVLILKAPGQIYQRLAVCVLICGNCVLDNLELRLWSLVSCNFNSYNVEFDACKHRCCKCQRFF